MSNSLVFDPRFAEEIEWGIYDLDADDWKRERGPTQTPILFKDQSSALRWLTATCKSANEVDSFSIRPFDIKKVREGVDRGSLL